MRNNNNNNGVVNNNYVMPQDFILFFKFPKGTPNNFLDMYRHLGTRPQKGSPVPL